MNHSYLKVFRVRYLMSRGGKTVGHFRTDMIYIDQIPHLVLDWLMTDDGEKPGTMVPLDPALLVKMPGWVEVDYMYEGPVEDTRPFH